MMRMMLVVGFLALAVAGGAYGIRSRSGQAEPSISATKQTRDVKSTVTPDPSFAEFFGELDKQWNPESKARLLAVSPTSDMRISTSTTATDKEK